MSDKFEIKDNGERQSFDSGMVRDTTEGKVEFIRVLAGPMFRRWAQHLTSGAAKYPNNEDGTANWTLASGEKEYNRFRDSALRHLIQWLEGDRSEDHAAAVFFNINGAEYVRDKMNLDVEVMEVDLRNVYAVDMYNELNRRAALSVEQDVESDDDYEFTELGRYYETR